LYFLNLKSPETSLFYFFNSSLTKLSFLESKKLAKPSTSTCSHYFLIRLENPSTWSYMFLNLKGTFPLSSLALSRVIGK